MAPKNSYSGMTKRARRLLDMPESMDVEFKRTIKALEPTTLVAFANSPKGGAILVGVEEYTTADGVQKGRPVGCPVDDGARLQIVNKGITCVPPIPVLVVAENVKSTPFFRVEVRPSPKRPHATASGCYKIRDDGRTRPLLPAELLAMLLDVEGGRFRERFDEASQGFLDRLHEFEGDVKDTLSSMSSALGWAESNTDDTKSTVDQVAYDLANVGTEVRENRERLAALLPSLDVADPVKARVTLKLQASLVEELRTRPEILEAIAEGRAVSLTVRGDAARLLSQEEVNETAGNAAAELIAELEERGKSDDNSDDSAT